MKIRVWRDVITEFVGMTGRYCQSVNGSIHYRTGEVSTQDIKGRRVLQIVPCLYSYKTLLAYVANGEWEYENNSPKYTGGEWYVNVKRYSQTTTRQQSALKSELTKLGHDYNTFEGR